MTHKKANGDLQEAVHKQDCLGIECWLCVEMHLIGIMLDIFPNKEYLWCVL